MRIRFSMLVALTICCGAGGAAAQSTDYPLAIENCGRTVLFENAPERAVTIGQSTTELLYALGLGDRVVGTAVWFNDVLAEYRTINASVPRLADNDPSFESVVSKRPQLVAAQFEWHVGPAGAVGTREQFDDLGITTYIMPPDCVGKDNTTGGDGTRTTPFRMDSIYRAIAELGAIFDVQDRGAALTAKLKSRTHAAMKKARKLGAENLSAVVWFSSPDIKLDAYVAGRNGVPGYMLEALGIRNVIETDEEWPLVGWETIAKANPDIIVIARMDRRRFPADDYRLKLDFLRNDPVTSRMDAVIHNRILIIDAQAIEPSIRIASGLEAIADSLQPLDVTQ